MAIIKLCYLQQAITITSEGAGISKKKLIEAPLAFRTSTIKQYTTGILQAAAGNERVAAVAKAGVVKEEGAKLIIETPAAGKQPVKQIPAEQTASVVTEIKTPANTKLSALDKIRKQYQGNGNTGPETVNEPIEIETLKRTWADYVVKLKEARNPAAQSFDLAILRIKDENSFEVVTANNIEQKFIEQDRNKLFVYLKEKLKNKQLQFTVLVEEKTADRPEIERTLNSKEQYQKIVEQYPLVRELKERLRLELDY
jgi:DNA polymerase-3 subunit gamma/tau